jgi:hypothetical protein
MAESAGAMLVLALLASWLGGAPAGLGVTAAGALAIANFWWLARGVSSTAASGRQARLVWTLSAGSRFVALLAAFAFLFASGWVHPAAVVAGLTVVPGALIFEGLHAARKTAER